MTIQFCKFFNVTPVNPRFLRRKTNSNFSTPVARHNKIDQKIRMASSVARNKEISGRNRLVPDTVTVVGKRKRGKKGLALAMYK